MAESLSIFDEKEAPSPAPRTGPRGLGGWLILLLLEIWANAAARLAFAIPALVAIFRVTGIHLHAVPAGLLPAATAAIVGFVGAIVGFLLARKSPRGPVLAKLLLLAECGYYAVRLYAMLVPNGPITPAAVPQWVRPAAYLFASVLCVGYLFRSRRVENTYYAPPAPVPVSDETDPRIARIRPWEEVTPATTDGPEEIDPRIARIRPWQEAAPAQQPDPADLSDPPVARARPWQVSSPPRLPEQEHVELPPPTRAELEHPEPRPDELHPAPPTQEVHPQPPEEEFLPAVEPPHAQEPQLFHPAPPAQEVQPEPTLEDILPAPRTVEPPHAKESPAFHPSPRWKHEPEESHPAPQFEEPRPEPESVQSQPAPVWKHETEEPWPLPQFEEPQPEPELNASQPAPQFEEPHQEPESEEFQPSPDEHEFAALHARVIEGITQWLSSAAKDKSHASFLGEANDSGDAETVEAKLLRQVNEICDHAWSVHIGQFPTLPNTADSNGSLAKELQKWAVAQAALRLTRSLDIRAAMQVNAPWEKMAEDREYLLAIADKNSSEDAFGRKVDLAEYQGHPSPEIALRLILKAQRDMFEAEMWAHVASLAGDSEFPQRFAQAGAKTFQGSQQFWREYLSHMREDRSPLRQVGV